MPLRSTRVSVLLAVCMLASILGCDKPAEITSYDVPSKAGLAAQPLEQRMLVATILRDDNAWFIKAMGPPDDVANAAGALRSFVDNIGMPEDQPGEIQWEAPKDWATKPPSQFRQATFLIPGSDPPLEVAISKLGYPGKQDEYLLMNVNRWRGQIGLKPVEKIDSAAGVETIEVAGETIWMFDGTGTASAGGMMPPFARGGATTQTPTRPKAPSPPKQLPKAELVVEIPEDWEFVEKGSMGSRTYRLGEGELQAKCKLSDFGAFGMMADPLSNVNRWRRQLGLEELDQEQFDESIEKISISETDGILTTIDKQDNSERMLASMVVKGGKAWFFQLTGTPAAVDSHREAFVQLLSGANISVPEAQANEEGE